jgi:uncharacterized protein YggE
MEYRGGMSETIITVAGSSQLRRNPERARVRIGIGFEGSKRDSVLAATRAAHESLTGSLESLLDEEHGPVLNWHSEDIRVWGQRPWSQDNSRLPVEFHSAVFVDAEFDDFEALSEWIDVVSIREGIAIDGIDWLLSRQTERELQAEARQEAIADALTKAREYASALGLGEVTPISISDPGLLDNPVGGAPGASLMMAKGAPGGGGMELRPSAISVEAAVHARFSASTPLA